MMTAQQSLNHSRTTSSPPFSNIFYGNNLRWNKLATYVLQRLNTNTQYDQSQHQGRLREF